MGSRSEWPPLLKDSIVIMFGTLHPDGIPTDIRHIEQAHIAGCPYCILVPEHYGPDGTCKCDDPEEQARMIRDWGYSARSFTRDK